MHKTIILHFQEVQLSSVQSLSRVRLFATPWIATRQASLSITQSLLKLLSMESVMPSSHLILCHPLLLLPPIPPSIRVFSNESTLWMRWSKYWSFSLSISPSSEHPGLISFIMDWLDLLAVQGTLKSLLQHHSSKASILLCSAFFTVQLSHPYMTTGKTIAKRLAGMKPSDKSSLRDWKETPLLDSDSSHSGQWSLNCWSQHPCTIASFQVVIGTGVMEGMVTCDPIFVCFVHVLPSGLRAVSRI